MPEEREEQQQRTKRLRGRRREQRKEQKKREGTLKTRQLSLAQPPNQMDFSGKNIELAEQLQRRKTAIGRATLKMRVRPGSYRDYRKYIEENGKREERRGSKEKRREKR